MDTAINPGGDFDTDIIGRPYTIDGTDVLLQKIYICLSGHRGGFIYDRELGGELYKIVLSDDNAEELLEIRAREAVKDIREAEVCGVRIRDGAAYVFVNIDDRIYNIALRGI